MSAHIPRASGARLRLRRRPRQLPEPWRSKDWQLLPVIREREYTFVTNVTNNGANFLALFGKEPLHPGFIIIVPNVMPVLQRELFKAALDHIGAVGEGLKYRHSVNTRALPSSPLVLPLHK